MDPLGTEPFFEIRRPQAPHQECGACGVEVDALDDELRVVGWIVYDGRSQTGKPLHVRRCPACQQSATEPRPAAPHAALF